MATVGFPEKGLALVFYELFSTTPLVSVGQPLPLQQSGNAKVFFLPSGCYPMVSFLFLTAYLKIPRTAVSPPGTPTPNPASADRSTTVVMSSSYSAAVGMFPGSHVFLELRVEQSLSL